MIQFEVGPDVYELEADEIFRPGIERQFLGITKMDAEIEGLQIPKSSLSLFIAIKLIRWYQRRVSPRLGNRCVFDRLILLRLDEFSLIHFRFLNNIQVFRIILYLL